MAGRSSGAASNGMTAGVFDVPIGADVSAFEEYLDSAGNVVTHYVVNVTANQQSYQLKKRYSEFSDLFNALKDHALFANYRFPNKSLFNTHSQFTKERRRQGFDELVKLASKLKPLPKEVVDFLEIEDDCGPASLHPTAVASSTSATSSDQPTSAAATSGAVNTTTSSSSNSSSSGNITSTSHHEPEMRRRMSTENRMPKGMVNVATIEQEINVQKRDYFLQVLPSSTCLASAAYATLVAANVIDISSTTTARMSITVIFFAFTLNVFRTLFFESPDYPKGKQA